MKTDDIAQEWARGSRDALKRSGIRTWFDGPRFYSYSTEIARKIGTSGFAWVTSQKYSVSTSRHTQDAIDSAHRCGFRVVRADNCPTEEEVQEIIDQQTGYRDLMENCNGTVSADVREPPPCFSDFAKLRAEQPDEFEPLTAQEIFNKICDRLKVHTAPIVISDQPKFTGTELQIPAGRPARQTWFNLAHALAHSIDMNATQHGILFGKRLAKICGMIKKDFEKIKKIGPHGRAGAPRPPTVERPALVGAKP